MNKKSFLSLYPSTLVSIDVFRNQIKNSTQRRKGSETQREEELCAFVFNY